MPRFPHAAALGFTMIVPAALAQSPPAPVRMPEVTVSATRMERDTFDLPVAADSIGAREIHEDNPQVNLSETLRRIPGLLVRNRENYAQDLQISTRGFGSRAAFGVRGLRLIADGIPATMPDGQSQAASFDLGSAERIEVLRGPFSSLYGNAAGGVIQVFTADGPSQPTLTGRAYAGSYGERKFGLQFGGTHGHYNYVAHGSRFATGGYREHSAARRDQVNGKLTVETANDATLTIVVNALDQPQSEDPRGLTAVQAAANPRQAGDNALLFNTRKSVSQSQLGATYDFALSSRDRLQAHVYAGDRQVTQFLGIPLAAQSAPAAAGGVVDLDRGFAGAGLRLTRTEGSSKAPFNLTAGIDYERMSERRKGFMNDFGLAGLPKRDEDDVVTSTALYGEAGWTFAQSWSLLAGLRYTRVAFDTRDYFLAPGNPDDSGGADFARATPAIGLVHEVTPSVNLYANFGEGFETPTFAEIAYRTDGTSGLNLALRPAKSVHRELGLKVRYGEAGTIDLTVFRIDVDDEIVVDDSVGGRTTFRNATATRRDGVEFNWEDHFAGGFEAALAYTVLDARFEQAFTSGSPPAAIAAGNRLPGVPRSILYAALVWRHPGSGFHAGVEALASSKVYVDDANSEFAAGYTVWNASAGFEQRHHHWRLQEFVRIDNIADRRYIGSVIVGESTGRYYEPAAGRALLVGIVASLTF